PSPSPSPSPSPNPSPSRTIDSVAWTDAALRQIAPIRGSQLVTPRAPDAKAAFAKLRKAAQGYDPLLKNGLREARAEGGKMESVRAFFAEASPPAELDLETQAAAFALLASPMSWNDDDRGDDFVRFWIAAAGAAFAFRAYARASELVVSAKHDHHVALLAPGAKIGDQEWWRTRGGPPWRALRLAVALASDAEHAELATLAEGSRRTSSPSARSAFAVALARTDWCLADADAAIA